MTLTKIATIAALSAALATPASALELVRSNKSVADTMDALVAAVEGAGAKVVARVDHAAAADGVGIELKPLQKLIFGNPKLGSQAMAIDERAGLVLPMQVVVYEDSAGDVWLSWEAPSDSFEPFANVDPEAEFVKTMNGALKKLTAKAAE